MGWWRRNRRQPPVVTPNEFKPEQLVNDLAAVSFEYRNGTTLTLRGDALTVWATFYRLLISIHESLSKVAQQKSEPPSAPATTLADELKKRS